MDSEVANILDEQVALSPDLAPDRSEIANSVMKGFFKAGVDHRVGTRKLFILNRDGRLETKTVHNVHTEAGPVPGLA